MSRGNGAGAHAEEHGPGPVGPQGCLTPAGRAQRRVRVGQEWGGPPANGGSDQALPHTPAAEANAISEDTETLHLSPAVTTAYVGPSAVQRPGVCERSCEELGSMASELSGLRIVVNQLHESLRKVVGAGAARHSTSPPSPPGTHSRGPSPS